MRLIDANLLLYAHHTVFPEHQRARDWLDGTLAESARLAMPWESLLAFARVSLNPRLFERPEPPSDTWNVITAWLAHPNVWIPTPTDAHAAILNGLWPSLSHHNQVPDAHLAALAIEHGLELCTTDRGFARYPGLRWRNPLATSPR